MFLALVATQVKITLVFWWPQVSTGSELTAGSDPVIFQLCFFRNYGLPLGPCRVGRGDHVRVVDGSQYT